MKYDPRKPYNDLPLLFPAEKYWKKIEIFEQLNKANKKLAELKGRLSSIPNLKIFINTLSLQEAKDSSSIENIFTTTDKLFKAFTASTEGDPHTKEVLRYGKALTNAFESIKGGDSFSVDLIESIYRIIKNKKDGIRDKEVYIGNEYTKVYTPPCCEDIILNKLKNWLTIANQKNKIDPLIKMAVLHYQFEAIHPFIDGNGRVGRILNILYLSAQNLLDEPILYHSGYINNNKNEYYKLLENVTVKNEWGPWIIYMLKSIELTARNTLNKVKAIIELFDKTKRIIKNEIPSIYSYELVEILFTQVYCKYSFLMERGIASRNTARKYMNKLIENGFVEKEKIGNEFIFKNIGLYNLIKQTNKF